MKPKYFKQGLITSRVSIAIGLKRPLSIHCFSGEKDLAQAVPHGICIHFVAHLMLSKVFKVLHTFFFGLEASMISTVPIAPYIYVPCSDKSPTVNVPIP